MKKKFIVVIIILMLTPNVLAKEKCNDKKYIENEYKEYKWYKIKEESSYFTYGNNTDEFSFLDKDDYINTAYSDWENELPSAIEGRTINKKTEYIYKKIKPIKYIFINNIKTNKKILNLKDIEINNINDIECINCKIEDDVYILNEGSYLKLTVNEEFSIDDFTYNIKDIDYFELYFSVDNNFSDISYDGLYDKGKIIITKLKDYFSEDIISNEKIDKSNYKLFDEKNFYQYQDKLFRYYKKKREYSDIYSANQIDDYIFKDEKDYIVKNKCDILKINIDGDYKLDKVINNTKVNDNSKKISNILPIIIIIWIIISFVFIKLKKINLL